MKIFAETFQSCFKDGLNGTFDYKMIPSAIILVSMLFAILLSLPIDSIVTPVSLSYETTVGCICVTLSLIISYIRPCKSLIMNMSLSFHTTLCGLLGILLGLWKQNFLVSTEAIAIGLAILPVFPHTVIMVWAALNIISQVRSTGLCSLHNFKRISFTMKMLEKNHEYEDITQYGSTVYIGIAMVYYH